MTTPESGPLGALRALADSREAIDGLEDAAQAEVTKRHQRGDDREAYSYGYWVGKVAGLSAASEAIEALATPGAGKIDHREKRGMTTCTDCPSVDFTVYNEKTATLTCAECGQITQLAGVSTPAPVAVESGWVLTMRSGVAAMNDNVIGTFNDYATAISVGGMLYDADKMNHPEYRTFDAAPTPQAAAQVTDADADALLLLASVIDDELKLWTGDHRQAARIATASVLERFHAAQATATRATAQGEGNGHG